MTINTQTKKRTQTDPELTAIRRVGIALSPLLPDARRRVLRYVQDKAQSNDIYDMPQMDRISKMQKFGLETTTGSPNIIGNR